LTNALPVPAGLKGKLSKLPAGSVHINSTTPELGRKVSQRGNA